MAQHAFYYKASDVANRVILANRRWVEAALFAALLGVFLSGPSHCLIADEAPDDKDEYNTRLFIAQSDGSQMKQLADLPEYQKQGSPSWSRDGKLIAFDAWKPQLGETFSASRIVVVNADGSNPRAFEDGAMPSFSPGGHRIAFSRPQSGGVWVMDLDGEGDQKFVQIDSSGWGTDWSPDGKIVYGIPQAGGGDLRVVNIVEGRRDLVFEKQPRPYSQIFWNMAWSPDGKRIVFKALNRDGKQEIAIVDLRGEKPTVSQRYVGEVLASFAWHPDGSRILFVMKDPERGRYQIHSVAPDTKDPPQLLPAQDELRDYSDVTYSPDGKQILVSCHKRTPKKPKP
jgi:Tol biopolymer transport system component